MNGHARTFPTAVRGFRRASAPRQSGFTLIELMISMTLGLLVLAAISTILVNTGKANREQTSIARLQENGRFALGRMVADLRMTGAQYCTGFSNRYQQGPNHIMRPLTVLTAAGTANGLLWGLPRQSTVLPAPASLTSPWYLSPRYFIQGHECTSGTCAPVVTVLGGVLPQLPAVGTGTGQRANRSDALTVRYLATAGVSLAADHANGITPLVITGNANAAPLNFQAGDLAMVSNCSVAEVFSATAAGTTITPAGNLNNTIREYTRRNDARVFNFSRDFRTVSYFLGIRTNAEGGANISSLVRRENNVDQLIADGVERLEILYGVDAGPATGFSTHFLTADQVQNGVSATGVPLACAIQPDGLSAQEPGCLWRQVHTIDIALLVNTVTDASTSATEPFSFSGATPAIVEQAPPAVLPSGLPAGRMFRKEFRTRVNLRNFTN